eukprot:g458.t1
MKNLHQSRVKDLTSVHTVIRAAENTITKIDARKVRKRKQKDSLRRRAQKANAQKVEADQRKKRRGVKTIKFSSPLSPVFEKDEDSSPILETRKEMRKTESLQSRLLDCINALKQKLEQTKELNLHSSIVPLVREALSVSQSVLLLKSNLDVSNSSLYKGHDDIAIVAATAALAAIESLKQKESSSNLSSKEMKTREEKESWSFTSLRGRGISSSQAMEAATRVARNSLSPEIEKRKNSDESHFALAAALAAVAIVSEVNQVKQQNRIVEVLHDITLELSKLNENRYHNFSSILDPILDMKHSHRNDSDKEQREYIGCSRGKQMRLLFVLFFIIVFSIIVKLFQTLKYKEMFVYLKV